MLGQTPPEPSRGGRDRAAPDAVHRWTGARSSRQRTPELHPSPGAEMRSDRLPDAGRSGRDGGTGTQVQRTLFSRRVDPIGRCSARVLVRAPVERRGREQGAPVRPLEEDGWHDRLRHLRPLRRCGCRGAGAAGPGGRCGGCDGGCAAVVGGGAAGAVADVGVDRRLVRRRTRRRCGTGRPGWMSTSHPAGITRTGWSVPAAVRWWGDPCRPGAVSVPQRDGRGRCVDPGPRPGRRALPAHPGRTPRRRARRPGPLLPHRHDGACTTAPEDEQAWAEDTFDGTHATDDLDEALELAGESDGEGPVEASDVLRRRIRRAELHRRRRLRRRVRPGRGW